LGVEVGVGISFMGGQGEGCLELFYTPFVMIPLRIGGVLRSQDRGVGMETESIALMGLTCYLVMPGLGRYRDHRW
jgi:hypothetical protein